MALKRVAQFNWDVVLSKVKDEATKKSLNVLRGRTNDILGKASRATEPAPIDFSAVKGKLKFAGAGVDALQKIYESRSIPQYTSNVPAFEKKRRDELIALSTSLANAAKVDLEIATEKLAEAESQVINEESTVEEYFERHPEIGERIEQEVHDKV